MPTKPHPLVALAALLLLAATACPFEDAEGGTESSVEPNRAELFGGCDHDADCDSGLCTFALYPSEESGLCTRICEADRDCATGGHEDASCRDVPTVSELGSAAAHQPE